MKINKNESKQVKRRQDKRVDKKWRKEIKFDIDQMEKNEGKMSQEKFCNHAYEIRLQYHALLLINYKSV